MSKQTLWTLAVLVGLLAPPAYGDDKYPDNLWPGSPPRGHGVGSSFILSSAVILDLGDTPPNESADTTEIATTGDTNSVFTLDSPDKLLIDLTKDWPKADQCDVALTGDNATAFFGAGTFEDALITGSDESNEIDDDVMPFDDADANWTAAVIGQALEELDDENGGDDLPNKATGKVNWEQLMGVPTGFADGADAGGGTVLNVKNPPYNAVGDGVNDDTDEIQAAVNDVPATGGCVYFPAGTYAVTNPINITASKVCLYGEGRGSSILKRTVADPSDSMIELEGGVTNVRIERLELEGTGDVVGEGAAIDITNNNSADIQYSHLYVHEWNIGILIRGTNVRVTDSEIRNTYNSAIAMGGLNRSADNIWIERNLIYDAQSGGVAGNGAIHVYAPVDDVETVTDLFITHNVIDCTNTICVGVGTDGGNRVHITDNELRFTGEAIANSASNTLVADNDIYDSTAGIMTCWGTQSENMIMTGNNIINVTNGNCFTLSWCKDLAEIDHMVISNNVCQNPAVYGFQSYPFVGPPPVTQQRGYIGVRITDNIVTGAGVGIATFEVGNTNKDILSSNNGVKVLNDAAFWHAARVKAEEMLLPPNGFNSCNTCNANIKGGLCYDTDAGTPPVNGVLCVCTDQSGGYRWDPVDSAVVVAGSGANDCGT